MITALLLVCLLGTTDCRPVTSDTFFDTIQQCENFNKATYEKINGTKDSKFFVLDTKCVAWNEKDA